MSEAKKHDPRVEAYGTVDEANAAIGLALCALEGATAAALTRIQNDLFDVGADLCTPDRGEDLGYEPLRVTNAQVERLEREIDAFNADLQPLDSFVLPGGTEAAARLHVARTITRRAERRVSALMAAGEPVGESVLKYLNRLSDLLFVLSRVVNQSGPGDVKWVPGQSRAG